jgi:alpha-tubulin suppressor-like RCC1 family protein
LGLRPDGVVWGWGSNGNGQLGEGTTNDSLAGHTHVCSRGWWISPRARTHSLALKGDTTVWVAGYNAYGQLGDGTTTQRETPVQVPNLTNVVAVAAGTYHALALKSDDLVWAWGYNGSGQLGDGTTTNRLTPVQVQNLTNVKAIASSATANHSLALKRDGTVWAWGNNQYGQLGDGTTTQRNTPVQVQIPHQREGHCRRPGSFPRAQDRRHSMGMGL